MNTDRNTLYMILLCAFLSAKLSAWQHTIIHNFDFKVRVLLTIPHFEAEYEAREPVPVVYFALPNGNTIEQTMGRTQKSPEEWRFGIQNIDAQTQWLREYASMKNLVTVYLEAGQLSWSAWKKEYSEHYTAHIRTIDSSVKALINKQNLKIYLNGHSGGGRFIFSYLDAFGGVPDDIVRISFLDSNYGYEFLYKAPFLEFIKRPNTTLTVFSYNDSVALLNGKRIVSDTGGTWYRTFMMLHDLEEYYTFNRTEDSVLIRYITQQKNIHIILKKNPDQGIYHTQQVAYNGFIHSILAGTPFEEKGYNYYAAPVYSKYIAR